MSHLPNFLVIGAARSGTTALYTYLKQHPSIFMSPVKEANFFAFRPEELVYRGPGADHANNSVAELESYRRLFNDATTESAIGEASPLYLYAEQAPKRIHDLLSDAKLIVILRNPIEQAFSHFLYARRLMIEPLESFDDALKAERQRQDDGWIPMFQYSSFPRYHEQLTRYLTYFDRSQIYIHLYEDFQEAPVDVLKNIFDFLNVDSGFTPDISYRPNTGGEPRSRFLQNLVMKPRTSTRLLGQFMPTEWRQRIRDAVSQGNLEKPTISGDAENFLKSQLSDDIDKLQDLINRDLSHWLS